MQKNAIIAIVAVVIVVAAGAGVMVAINNKPSDADEDFGGFEVKAVDNLDNGIVAVGQDSFRWVTYFGLSDKCVMVDMNDKTNYLGKSFMYVGKANALANAKSISGKDLQFTTTNCGITDADMGTIIDLNPSVVVVPAGFETDYKKQMDGLRAANLHIVHIGYIYTFLDPETFEITKDTEKQLDILAKTFNKQDRADELRGAFTSIVKDIRGIAAKVTEKKSGYISCLAYNGAHGADSSIAYFMPFALANVTNIMAGQAMDYEGSGVDTYSATKIKENMSKDTILFLDATGLYTATDNTSKGILQLFYNKDSTDAHKAFISYPYIWTGINYESVLICAYQILHDAYGLLSDAELKEKVDNVNAKFLGSADSNRAEVTSKNVPLPAEGTSIYDDESAVFKAFRGNHTHGEVTINADGTISGL